MAYQTKSSERRDVQRTRRRTVEGQQAVVYYGRPVPEWPRAWML
jgi:hypothetical protein